MEIIRLNGNNLVPKGVYDIYKNKGNKRIGICLVISKNNRNNSENNSGNNSENNSGNNSENNSGNEIKLRRLIENDELSLLKSEIYGKNPVDLTDANLTSANLTRAFISGSTLICANLISANLTHANLNLANLTGANLTKATLTGATLINAILNEADLTRAILNDADLTRAKLNNTILNEANLTQADLTGAKLIKAELFNATLTGSTIINANLTEANLTLATLTGAILTHADLTGAALYHADLTGATLRNAILTGATLRNVHLTLANLTGANLIDADLFNADLTGATIYSDSLSEEQLNQIMGEPNYIERVRPFGLEERIELPEELINPIHSNNSCPNFNGLYEFIMRKNLSGRFFFIYEGPNRRVIDLGGPKRDVFDKILPVYTNKFFKEIEDNEDYVILRESIDMKTMKTLFQETEQLILLARASETKIFLKIDPILLSLFVESDQPFIKYFNNNKRNRFSKLYTEFNQYIEHINNNNELLKHNRNKRNLMKTLKNEKLKNEELKKTLEQEIRFRRFAITRGFTDINQFSNMKRFIKKFYNISPEVSVITCELKFDVETIIKRIKLYKKIKQNNFDDYTEKPIPLEQYIRLSQNNQSILILNRADDIIMNYPYLIPFLNFILGPESSDDDRKLFVKYISGASSYTGELKIYLSYKTYAKAGREFHSSTCYKYLELFKNKKQNRHSITVELIRQQLELDIGFGRA